MRIQTPEMNHRPATRVSTGDVNLAPLKITALIYLREARINEEYENMTELVRYARQFGADRREIADALNAVRV
ncbi:MAG: hypothetical protein KC900_05775 [Candidatus Omnitrophica bacterium]|nr:hypothetical protein [Candidatus Omnitrophota bacterium]